jgi:hypothetical protein
MAAAALKHAIALTNQLPTLQRPKDIKRKKVL